MLCILVGSGFFGFWGEDSRPNRPDRILDKRTTRWSSQVGRRSAQFRLGLPSELGHQLNWTPLSEIGTQTIIHNQQETQVRRHVFGIQINRQYKQYSVLQTFKDHDGLVHIAQLFFSHLRPITLMKITTRIKIPCYL